VTSTDLAGLLILIPIFFGPINQFIPTRQGYPCLNNNWDF